MILWAPMRLAKRSLCVASLPVRHDRLHLVDVLLLKDAWLAGITVQNNGVG